MALASTIPPRLAVTEGSLRRTIQLHMPRNLTPGLSQGDPMDTSPGQNMAPPYSHPLSNSDIGSDGAGASASGAAAAAQQPKVVQTAFIHKLYKYENTSALE